jgi:hypothetical protein
LKDALYIAFEAKKRAELAGGVGQMTDIMIIDEGGIHRVAEGAIRILDEIYNDKETESYKTKFDKRISNLDVQTVKLGSTQ